MDVGACFGSSCVCSCVAFELHDHSYVKNSFGFSWSVFVDATSPHMQRANRSIVNYSSSSLCDNNVF